MLLQVSNEEILREEKSQEPRLRRLLGHISTFENVSRWRTENEQKERIAKTDQRNEFKNSQAPKSQYRSSIAPSGSTLKLRTLADFESAICAHVVAEKQTTVFTEEVTSDIDFEDENDPDETQDDESDDESAWSDDEDPIIEFIKQGTRCLLQQDVSDDDVVFYRSTADMVLRPTENVER